MSPRNVIVITILTAAALASWYLARQGNVDDAMNATPELIHRGYYLKSARILGTGADGQLLYEIQAKHAEQQDDQRIAFIDVLINYSPASGVPWIVNADSALIHPGERRIRLIGNVLAISREGFSGQDTEIRTQYLELDPETFIAETDQRVQIRIGTRSLTATGMLASFQENRLELKSNVSGKFVP